MPPSGPSPAPAIPISCILVSQGSGEPTKAIGLRFVGPTLSNEGGGLYSVTLLPADPAAVVFDTVAGELNIRSARAANQSAIDNTKVGITNLGSDDGGGLGALESYATIPGGLNNTASGLYAFAAGQGAIAAGERSVSLNGNATGLWSVAIGGDAQAQTQGSIAMLGAVVYDAGTANNHGVNAVAIGPFASAGGNESFGLGGSANKRYSVALGRLGIADGERAVGLNGGALNASSIALPGGTTRMPFQLVQGSGMAPSRGEVMLSGVSLNAADGDLLLSDNTEFLFEDEKSYALRVTLLGHRQDAPGLACEVHQLLVSVTGGVASIAVDSLVTNQANGQGWTWSFVMTGLNMRPVLNGLAGQTVVGSAHVDWIETA